jgi:hypothetical protein
MPIELDDGLELGKDRVVMCGYSKARLTDVPFRDDLPVGHPLRGKRALRVVLSGMTDSVIDDDGRIVAIVQKEIEEIPEIGEVIRDR